MSDKKEFLNLMNRFGVKYEEGNFGDDVTYNISDDPYVSSLFIFGADGEFKKAYCSQ